MNKGTTSSSRLICATTPRAPSCRQSRGAGRRSSGTGSPPIR
ncbi:MAG: hypothetical protein VB124_04005 [Burkholderia sp.]